MGMKAQELRIGNWIDTYLGRVQTTGKELVLMRMTNVIIKARPIPLTDEWLLKFGFEKQVVFEATRYIINHYVFVTIQNRGIINFTLLNNSFSVELKYVHQLQNLYFALTGEELTI